MLLWLLWPVVSRNRSRGKRARGRRDPARRLAKRHPHPRSFVVVPKGRL